MKPLLVAYFDNYPGDVYSRQAFEVANCLASQYQVHVVQPYITSPQRYNKLILQPFPYPAEFSAARSLLYYFDKIQPGAILLFAPWWMLTEIVYQHRQFKLPYLCWGVHSSLVNANRALRPLRHATGVVSCNRDLPGSDRRYGNIELSLIPLITEKKISGSLTSRQDFQSSWKSKLGIAHNRLIIGTRYGNNLETATERILRCFYRSHLAQHAVFMFLDDSGTEQPQDAPLKRRFPELLLVNRHTIQEYKALSESFHRIVDFHVVDAITDPQPDVPYAVVTGGGSVLYPDQKGLRFQFNPRYGIPVPVAGSLQTNDFQQLPIYDSDALYTIFNRIADNPGQYSARSERFRQWLTAPARYNESTQRWLRLVRKAEKRKPPRRIPKHLIEAVHKPHSLRETNLSGRWDAGILIYHRQNTALEEKLLKQIDSLEQRAGIFKQIELTDSWSVQCNALYLDTSVSCWIFVDSAAIPPLEIITEIIDTFVLRNDIYFINPVVHYQNVPNNIGDKDKELLTDLRQLSIAGIRSDYLTGIGAPLFVDKVPPSSALLDLFLRFRYLNRATYLLSLEQVAYREVQADTEIKKELEAANKIVKFWDQTNKQRPYIQSRNHHLVAGRNNTEGIQQINETIPLLYVLQHMGTFMGNADIQEFATRTKSQMKQHPFSAGTNRRSCSD